jgi:hypothetical protein
MYRLQLLLLTLVLVLSGCAPWPVYQAYEGPAKPITEVAVILVRHPAYVDEIDGSHYYWRKQIPNEPMYEVHVLPGYHVFKGSYGDYVLANDPDVIWAHCLKGQVYETDYSLGWDNSLWIPRVYDWDMSIDHVGSVVEVAYRDKDEGRQPAHWKPLMTANK